MRWITIAPNGKDVKLSVDSFTDRRFIHRQVIDDVDLAKRYPHIFVPHVSASPQKLTEVPEVEKPKEDKKEIDSNDQKQILTEVPKTEDLEEDKPILKSEEVKDIEDSKEEQNLEDYTKKVLIKMAEDKGIEVPKKANKQDVIDLLK